VCKKAGHLQVPLRGSSTHVQNLAANWFGSNDAKAGTSAPAPVVKDFEAWSTNIDSRTLNDQAQRNFLSWVKTRAGATKNHTQLIQANTNTSRIAIMKKADDLGAQLFSSYFPQGSITVIGATQSWTDEQLAKSGWVTKCDVPSMGGWHTV
jgi:hypothetical protein